MNFNIDIDAVTDRLNKMDGCIDELRGILSNMESDISKGWDSERASSLVTPVIDEVKNSIEKMQLCTSNVRANVNQYMANVKTADTAGSLKSASDSE